MKKEHSKELVTNLLNGLISFEDISSKGPRELFDDTKLKELEEKSQKWLMQSLQSDFYMKNTEVKDSEFQCYKCHQRKIFAAQK